jgi:hypothetical protein
MKTSSANTLDALVNPFDGSPRSKGQPESIKKVRAKKDRILEQSVAEFNDVYLPTVNQSIVPHLYVFNSAVRALQPKELKMLSAILTTDVSSHSNLGSIVGSYLTYRLCQSYEAGFNDFIFAMNGVKAGFTLIKVQGTRSRRLNLSVDDCICSGIFGEKMRYVNLTVHGDMVGIRVFEEVKDCNLTIYGDVNPGTHINQLDRCTVEVHGRINPDLDMLRFTRKTTFRFTDKQYFDKMTEQLTRYNAHGNRVILI